MTIATYSSLIFDLDGTIWDTSGTIDRSWNKALLRFAGLRPQFSLKEILSIMGKHHADILADLFPSAAKADAEACLAECYVEHREDIRENNAFMLYKDAERVIRELAKTRSVFLVSNCDQPYLDLFLDKFSERESFSATLCHGATGKDKASNIRQIVEEHELSKVAYIGDTATDAQAAKSAELPFIFANYGFGKVENSDHSISALEELL
jgi:phosphoglycolate phosphatase